MATQPGFFFDQDHGIARVGDVQGRLQASDAPTDDHGPLDQGQGEGHQRLVVAHFLYDGLDDFDGLGRGLGLRFLVHPRALLPDVGNLALVGIEALRGRGLAEGGLVHRRRAGGHHHPVQIVLADGLFDDVLARVGTHIFVINGVSHAWIFADLLRHPLDIYRASNVNAAVADKNADSFHESSGYTSTMRRAHFQLMLSARINLASATTLPEGEVMTGFRSISSISG